MKQQYKPTAAFPEPNYTQTPNKFFEMIPDMTEAELRVTAVMIRETFGYHRDGFKMGLPKLAKATGLSRQGALDGAHAAEERGTFRRTNPDAQGEAEWELVIEETLHQFDPLHSLDTPLQLVEGIPQMGGGQVDIKERKKVNKEVSTPPAFDFSNMTVPEAYKVPTLKMFNHATGWLPADILWEQVHNFITDNALTEEQIKAAAIAWIGKGYNRRNVMGILEWAKNGTTGEYQQKPAESKPAVDEARVQETQRMLAEKMGGNYVPRPANLERPRVGRQP